MASDGAFIDGSADWVHSELELREGESLEDAAERILQCALSRAPAGREDDVTVTLARISE